uniref:Uncharacterized protein n=1 Tax=Avena sativa TaxID=4498 RepID=A0ACD5TNI9_AVESA
MNPLVDDFLGGKGGLLVAMGPTGSGKTHTVFGTAKYPGIVPLTLQKVFNTADESNSGNQPTRSFCLSMFEILCEGKAERILDLLSDAADLVLQQSTIIKGLKEVAISNLMDAESLVSRGMLKRSTAATNANSESSRSQCIITIRAFHKYNDLQSEHLIGGSVLTIADLAGAERKKSTGNMGSRLIESNFINNTSMVFGNCLRALLDHQKNQKKTLEKHFKNSTLTRYLRDYLEGRKKMTLILNVKQGDDDYSDTSYLLRQASPYMKIRYTSLRDSSDLASQKRSSVSLICQENKKRRKVQKPEDFTAEGKGNVDKYDDTKPSERDEFLNSELQRLSRSEQIMKNLFRALWAVSKQKLLESESAAKSMKELLSEKDIQIIELKKELNDLKSCSHEKFPVAEDTTPIEQNDVVSLGQAALSLASNQTDLGSSDTALDDFHVVDKKLDNSESFSEQTSAHDGGVTHANSYLDHPSDRSFTEHILPCIKSEPASLSPHGCGKKASVEQSEEELTKVDDSKHDVDIKEMKHHDCPSSSQKLNFGTVAISSSQAFVDLQGMGAAQENPEKTEPVSGRCEPMVEKPVAEHDIVCGQRPDVTDGRGAMFPRVLNERPPQIKASTAELTTDEKENCPAQVTADKKEAEGVTYKEEDLCASKPSQTKKIKRRLLPVSAVMLKEFTGPDMDAPADTKRAADVGVKSLGEAAAGGRSEKLIRLLKGRPVTEHHRRS